MSPPTPCFGSKGRLAPRIASLPPTHRTHVALPISEGGQP
jgi:hypothetical protein